MSRTRAPSWDRAEAAQKGHVSVLRAGGTGVDVTDLVTMVDNATELEFTGATVTDNGDGTASIAIEAGTTMLTAITPVQLVANTDNWVPVDATTSAALSTATIIRASTDASRNLTGIGAPIAERQVILENVGTHDLVLKHDATSTAANRFYCPGDVDLTLSKDSAVVLEYDMTSSRWRVVAPTAPDGLTGFATPAIVYGTAAAGSATTTIRSDATIAKPTEADLSLSNVTTNDASSSQHGFLPKLPGGSSKFLREDGTFQLVSVDSISASLHSCRAAGTGSTSLTNITFTRLLYGGTDDWDTDNFHFTSAANLTGTVQKTATSAAIVGTSTLFTTELSVNQVISIPGTAIEIGVVKTITDNTHLTLWQTMANSASGQTATRRNEFMAVPSGLGGKYDIGALANWDGNTSGERILGYLINGANVPTAMTAYGSRIATGVANMAQGFRDTIVLSDGDYITIVAYQSSGGTRTINVTSSSSFDHFTLTRLPGS